MCRPDTPVFAPDDLAEIRHQAEEAERRLEIELARLREAGATADGEIGDPDPLTAISQTLETKQFDEIIISTLPHTVSHWLRLDLASKVERKFNMPVTQIVSLAE